MHIFDSFEMDSSPDTMEPLKPQSAALAEVERFKREFMRPMDAALSLGTPKASTSSTPLTRNQKRCLERARARWMNEIGLN